MRLTLLLASTALAVHSWSIPFFNTESSSTLQLHPLSPPETDPSSARAKRQAYQVYVDGDASVTVDKSGEAETGAWGQWAVEGSCSRTCGGGVQTEKRQCNGQCTGPSVRYVSCNVEPCEEGTGDYRSQQCASHNDEALDGKYFKWVPYKGKNKCELLCKPEGTGSFYYKWGEKVVDGTPCDAKGTDICVDGVCLPVGCDGKLGSDKKFDKCGKCDGNGSTCKTLEGQFDERNLSPGYHDIIKLPVGATAVRISELRDTSNNLALKNASGAYVLNGNSMIQTETDVEVAGTVFQYDDTKKESLVAAGPLKQEVTVALLHRKGNKDSAIRYEFSIPVDEDVPFVYKPGDWSACSVTCGKGVQKRTPFCVDTKANQRVADDLCDENNSTKPETEKECLTVDCEAEWFTGDWETCSASCGDSGEQYRVVYCHQVFKDGKRITVDDGNCTAERPPVRQGCNRFSCPEWQAGPWSACSEKCGDALQYRSVTCRSAKDGEEGKLLPADQCPEGKAQEAERTCNLGPCEGLKFTTSEWKLCTRCNDTEETREVKCVDTQGRAYQLEKCITNTTDIPIDTRTCATQPPCLYEWTTSEWSKCSTECGHGHKTRRVVCAIHQEGDLEVIDEGLCQGKKPNTTEPCTNEEDCTGTWFSGPWSNCTAECDGGTQTRVSVCLNYDHKPEPKWCDEAKKPADEQKCNTEACPTCFDSEFGCCPDNSTFATGDFFQGCSNCSLSEFGCCADNVTEATGPDGKGCLEYVELEKKEGEKEEKKEEVEGSGEGEEKKECTVTSEDGKEATVDCLAMSSNLTAEEGDLFGNETGNATLHCSKSEFGCCPDWYTPATGPNKEGCDSYVLGTCNETLHGCCLDNVTLARGPNYEGCGEASCAASLFGCCKDRKTIAFGPHYAGCERSSFPCELSQYGCCPDGETAALGLNGTGCGENCLTTKYGCCPDGKTTSKGKNNEGCGCEYAQFGCCPDGKSAAKGSGFYGCPESCAQSQYGCCPDGKTSARGAHKEGCPCQYTRYGCCPDGETTALGPKLEGCNDCRYAKHGCCADGITRALGPDYQGCPSTTLAPFLLGGTVAPSKISACSLTQDQGRQCASASFKLMYYYDIHEGRCSQFWYGGCEGNENRFPTKDMCETICVEPPARGRCHLPKVEGPAHCNSLEPRFFYEPATRQCKAFWWRGCLGNANNFGTWEECQKFCDGVEPAPLEPVTQPPPPPAPAPRAPYVPDSTRVEVQPLNPHTNVPAPQNQRENPALTMEDVCRAHPDAGPCEDYVERYFYNPATHSCDRFRYGGCGGNLNSFKDEAECLMRCSFMISTPPRAQTPSVGGAPQPSLSHAPIVFPQSSAQQPASSKGRSVCREKVDVGRCQGNFPSFYYEVATGTCVEFKYSGCGGNGNRFTSKGECEQLCVRAEQPGAAAGGNSACDERKETGVCPAEMQTQYTTKWFYNKADGVCSRFHYSGCGGTANRFDSEADCKTTCQSHISACDLPLVKGQCSGKHPAFFYNKEAGRCEEFLYSGCLGNINRFESIDECQATCPQQSPSSSVSSQSSSSLPSLSLPLGSPAVITEAAIGRCSQPKQVGHCKALIPSFYYDSAHGKCAPFDYGGCGGNGNRFATLDQCQRECEPEKHQALRMNPYATLADQPRDPSANFYRDSRYNGYRTQGPSRTPRKLRRFDKETMMKMGKLEMTTTTTHRPTTTEIARVLPSDDDLYPTAVVPSSPLPELCQLPMEAGPCFEKNLRWHYDESAGMCKAFYYTGCGANANNFESQEACERACGAFREDRVCEQKSEAGECQTAVYKWHWDKERRQCRQMVWGGCGGNGNRFSSKMECEQLCRRETRHSVDTDICLMDTDSGPCNDAISLWHYDANSRSCRQFTYGGCRGNGNRFLTKRDCERRCTGKTAPPTLRPAALPTPAALVQRMNQAATLTVPAETTTTSWRAEQIQAPAPKQQNTSEVTIARTQAHPVSGFALANHPTSYPHHSRMICYAAVDVGPCTERIPMWYYDTLNDKCKPFAYGGCQGNGNRFASQDECESKCQLIPRNSKRTNEKIRKTTLKTHEEGPFETGVEIRLTCDSSESRPIVWYKDGHVLEFSERVVEEDEFKQVVIRTSKPTDTGYYMCAVGLDGIFSERVHIKVNELPVEESFCQDIGGRDTCSKILARGLCVKKRYGSYCCRTCGSHGFEKFRF